MSRREAKPKFDFTRLADSVSKSELTNDKISPQPLLKMADRIPVPSNMPVFPGYPAEFHNSALIAAAAAHQGLAAHQIPLFFPSFPMVPHPSLAAGFEQRFRMPGRSSRPKKHYGQPQEPVELTVSGEEEGNLVIDLGG